MQFKIWKVVISFIEFNNEIILDGLKVNISQPIKNVVMKIMLELVVSIKSWDIRDNLLHCIFVKFTTLINGFNNKSLIVVFGQIIFNDKEIS